MEKILLGSRTEHPCFFDMAARFPWNDGRPNYGRGFRIGDRAGAYIRLLHWRQENPARRLVILEDSSHPESQHAASLSCEWLFSEIADEVWKLDPGEIILAPEGENIYDNSLWLYWKNLRYFRPPHLEPRLYLPPELIENFQKDISLQKIGSRFFIVQPLIDATYNQQRNREPQWWNQLIEILSRHRDVIVLGTPQSNQLLQPPSLPRVHIFSSRDPVSSLALMSLAHCFIGGETGLTLWAPILRIPTVGLMSEQHKGYVADTAPLSFGSPVNCFPIEADPMTIAQLIMQFANQYRL